MQTSFFKTSRGKNSTEPTTREPTHLYQAKPSWETYFIVIGSSYQLQSTRMDTSVPCSNILYGTIPPPIPPRKQFKDRPNAKVMYERATSLPAPSGILLEADHHWKHTQRTQPTTQRFFGRSYMAPTPSITTIQQIGIGIAHAYS